MNAAARTLSHGNLFKGDFWRVLKDKHAIFSMLLWGLVMCSALMVVYLKNVERNHVASLQSLNKQISQLDVQYNQLLLEKSLWGTPGRIQSTAIHSLNMKYAVPVAVIKVSEK